jgi:hypothetical protein
VGLVSPACLVSLAYLVYVESKEGFLQTEEGDSKIESGGLGIEVVSGFEIL